MCSAAIRLNVTIAQVNFTFGKGKRTGLQGERGKEMKEVKEKE